MCPRISSQFLNLIISILHQNVRKQDIPLAATRDCNNAIYKADVLFIYCQ